MQQNILHIMKPEKFNVPFINFVNEHFDISNHKFIFLSKPIYEYEMTEEYDVIWIKNDFLKLLKELNCAEKIILHGLWKTKFMFLLLINPWLLKKCYWAIWGGDLYPLSKKKWIKKQVIKRMGHFITYVKGDYELIRKHFNATGEYHQCLMYPSNLYKEYEIPCYQDETINIQIGNSGFVTNNHDLIFEKLYKFKDQNIKIYAPLSYGNSDYTKEIIEKGKTLFGEKFIPLTDFMLFEKYLDFLSKIDIAIFAHKRQQAMGNIITLLGLGKKVYMFNDITPWSLFEDIDVKVYNFETCNLELITNEIKEMNQKNVKKYFSKENYFNQLKKIFEN